MFDALTNALESAAGDRDVRVVLLEGSGGNFTAGSDLADFARVPSLDKNSPPIRFIRTLSVCEKPVVAKVEGHAVGVGTTMLLHCDLVYASTNARFAVPFVELGLVPEAGSSLLLPLRLGHQVAAELMLLPEPIPAERAKELRIVTAVFPAERLDDEVQRRVKRLASQAPAAIRETKRLLKRDLGEPLAKRIEAENVVFGQRLASEDTARAIRTFLEGRRRSPTTEGAQT